MVDAATIVNDAMEKTMEQIKQIHGGIEDDFPKNMSELNNMYVTSKDIDETIKRLSYLISEALNIAFDRLE